MILVDYELLYPSTKARRPRRTNNLAFRSLASTAKGVIRGGGKGDAQQTVDETGDSLTDYSRRCEPVLAYRPPRENARKRRKQQDPALSSRSNESGSVFYLPPATRITRAACPRVVSSTPRARGTHERRRVGPIPVAIFYRLRSLSYGGDERGYDVAGTFFSPLRSLLLRRQRNAEERDGEKGRKKRVGTSCIDLHSAPSFFPSPSLCSFCRGALGSAALVITMIKQCYGESYPRIPRCRCSRASRCRDRCRQGGELGETFRPVDHRAQAVGIPD